MIEYPGDGRTGYIVSDCDIGHRMDFPKLTDDPGRESVGEPMIFGQEGDVLVEFLMANRTNVTPLSKMQDCKPPKRSNISNLLFSVVVDLVCLAAADGTDMYFSRHLNMNGATLIGLLDVCYDYIF